MHIDIRGPWPVLFDGMKSYLLEGCDRGITIDQALKIIKQREKKEKGE